MMSVKRNIPLLYAMSFLIKRPMMPIITLYYLFYNLSFTEIGIIAGATMLFSIILEIPSGIVTDYIGKRTALFIACVFGLASQLMYFIGESFTPFLIAGILFAISVSFISGTRQALLYESLKSMGLQARYKKYSGRMVFYAFIFNGAVLLFVPLIYEVNKKAVFLIGMVFFIIAGIISLFLREAEESSKGNVIDHIRTAFSHSINNIGIRNAMLYSMVGSGIIFIMVDYYQPIMEISGLQVIYFGIAYFLMRIAMAFGSRLTHTLEKHISNSSIIIMILGAYSIILLGLSTYNMTFVISLIVLMRFLEGIHRIAVNDELQKNISAKNRTTIGSISNMFRNLYPMLIAPLMGLVADTFGIRTMLISLAAVYAAITLAFMAARIFRKQPLAPKPI